MNWPPVYPVRALVVKWAGMLCLLAVAPGLSVADGLEAARRTEQLVAELSQLVQQGHFEAVLAAWDGLPEEPADPRLWNARGLALAGLDRDREAVTAYERGIRIDPAQAEIHLNLAVSLDRLGVTGRAMAEFEQAVELAPATYEARLGLGRALLRFGRLPRARAELETARRLNEKDPRAWFALAELADAEGDVRAMQEAWAAVESRWPDGRTARRLAELNAGLDPVAARTWLETCLRRNPRDAGCAAAAGALALESGDLTSARRLLTTALELDEDQPRVLHNLLLSYQIEGVIEPLERVVKRWPPRRPESWGVVALARRTASDTEGALAAAEAAVELAPESLDLVNLLAVLLDENGRAEEAVARWEWVLQRDAEHTEAKRNLAQRRR